MNNRLAIALVAMVVVALVWGLTGCYADQWQPPPAQPAEKKPEVEKPQITKVRTEDRAILAVYEHLLSEAKGSEAKEYLADFYATCDKWSAKTELFKDGTSMWHVVVDMTHIEKWEKRPYWQQASWFILQDNKVIPSNRFQASALRIEADLQELSLPPQPQPAE